MLRIDLIHPNVQMINGQFVVHQPAPPSAAATFWATWKWVIVLLMFGIFVMPWLVNWVGNVLSRMFVCR